MTKIEKILIQKRPSNFRPCLPNWPVEHDGKRLDPDQAPALELLSRAASSVGTKAPPARNGPNTGSLAPGERKRVKKNKKNKPLVKVT